MNAAAEAMHLAIFIHSLAGGGAQRRIVTLANALATRGVRVQLVVVGGDGPLGADLHPSVDVEPLQVSCPPSWVTRMPKRRHQMAASIPALASYLERARPDVLLSAASHANITALRARRRAAVPVPLVVRASNHLSRSTWNLKRTPYLTKWLAARASYRWADAVIAVSDGVADDITRWTGVPKERITVIPNPVVGPDLLEKAAASVDHPWLAPDAPPLVLAAGRLASQKDFPTLLRAFARLRRVRAARLVILGEGRKRVQLLRLARNLGMAPEVDLPGFVTNPFAWMRRAALFVLSSAWEGLPGVLVEAMACGCPVVSTDCPSGPREILEGGAYGRLVPVGDDATLARAMLATLDAPLPSHVLQGRAQTYAVAGAVDRYIEVLQNLVRRPTAAPARTSDLELT